MKKAFLWFLKDFQFARKRMGGTWYYIVITDTAAGIASPVSYWTQDLPDGGGNVLNTEVY